MMTYSVIGGPAIGFDLARQPGGDQVAAVLRTALAAGPEDLERLAGQHPGAAARVRWQQERDVAADEAATMLETLPVLAAALDEGGPRRSALLRSLETGLLGDVHALDRLIRRDVLDWTWLHSGPMAVQDPVAHAAADVLVDAATSGFLRELLSDTNRRAMAAPFLRAAVPLRGATVPSGLERVDQALSVLGAADGGIRVRWRQVVDELRVHTAQWAPAMHQATWALSLSERLRAGCDAQLAGVIAFRQAGFGPRDAAYGVWNALAGVIQAQAVGDLLPASESAVLLRPWHAVYGEDPSGPARS